MPEKGNYLGTISAYSEGRWWIETHNYCYCLGRFLGLRLC